MFDRKTKRYFMKKNLLPTSLFLAMMAASPLAFAQTANSDDRYGDYYSSTFQETDFGRMDENGVSIEKNLASEQSQNAQTSTTVEEIKSSKNITVVNKTSNIKTTMYYWTDDRGIKHFSDSARGAPKGAKTLVVMASKPKYAPPANEINYNEETIDGNQRRIPLNPTSAPPPQSLPPSSLPPLPPIPY